MTNVLTCEVDKRWCLSMYYHLLNSVAKLLFSIKGGQRFEQHYSILLYS